MNKYFYIILPLLLFLLFSCHPDQYILSYHFPSTAIKNDARAYLILMPGLRVYTMKNFKEKLIGMVGGVRYEKDSVVVDLMLDKRIPVGSGVTLFLCKQPNVVISLSKKHTCYRPSEIIYGKLNIEKVCQ
jgi:hypothetical protein